MFCVLSHLSTAIVGALRLDTVQAALKIEKAKLVWAVALNLLKGLFLTYFSQLYELTQLSCTFSASLLGLLLGEW